MLNLHVDYNYQKNQSDISKYVGDVSPNFTQILIPHVCLGIYSNYSLNPSNPQAKSHLILAISWETTTKDILAGGFWMAISGILLY